MPKTSKQKVAELQPKPEPATATEPSTEPSTEHVDLYEQVKFHLAELQKQGYQNLPAITPEMSDAELKKVMQHIHEISL